MMRRRISRRWAQTVFACLFSGTLLIGTNGCTDPTKVLDDINTAIAVIQQESSAWRTELPQLLNQLKQLGSDLIKQVGQLITEAENEAREDALCVSAYAQNLVQLSVVQLLNDIKIVNLLANQKPTTTPFVCAIQPDQITLAGIRSGNIDTVNLIGFNLYPSKIDSKLTDPAMSAEFINDDGNVVPVPPGERQFIAERGVWEIQLNVANWNSQHPLSNMTGGIQFLADGNDIPQGQTTVTSVTGPDTITVSPVPYSAFQVGTNVNIQVTAASSTGVPVTYNASGLPPGLAIDPSSGAITGVAPASVPYPSETWYPTVTVTDGTGASASVSFYLAISDKINCHVVKNMWVCQQGD